MFDEWPRELLYLSLRGLRLTINEQPGGLVQRSLALAVASAQLDCQLPRRATHEEVLLRSGASVRRDCNVHFNGLIRDYSEAGMIEEASRLTCCSKVCLERYAHKLVSLLSCCTKVGISLEV